MTTATAAQTAILVAMWRDQPSNHFLADTGNQKRTLVALERKELITTDPTGDNAWLTLAGRELAESLADMQPPADRAGRCVFCNRDVTTTEAQWACEGRTATDGPHLFADEAATAENVQEEAELENRYRDATADLDDLFAQGRKVVAAAQRQTEVRVTVDAVGTADAVDPEAPSPYLDGEGDLTEAGEQYLANIKARKAARQATVEQPPVGSTVGPERAVQPRRGMRFVHARHLVKVAGEPAAYWPHEVCQVTKVDDTAVHYGPVESGKRTRGAWWTAPDRFADEVLEILAERPRNTEVRTVADLEDGDVFSADHGQTWHTCATSGFGTVSVHCDGRQDENAPLRRIELERVETVWVGVR